jgi:hypothetical protein
MNNYYYATVWYTADNIFGEGVVRKYRNLETDDEAIEVAKKMVSLGCTDVSIRKRFTHDLVPIDKRKSAHDIEETAWDFVEKNFPNYHGSDLIAFSDDLLKIIDGEYTENDSAKDLLIARYDGNKHHPMVMVDYLQAMIKIYEESILNHLNK